jgi:dolichyl-phosphate beta-glucosyltransferase
MSSCVIVVPCYNEAERLDLSAYERSLSQHPKLRFLFVDDGSTDATLDVLCDFESKQSERVSVHHHHPNRGKAETVRAGMLAAFELGPDFVGYWDADLATPLDEIDRMIAIFAEHPEREVVIGARVKLLGRSIQRRATRHYLGRVGATLTSNVLRLPVYDTQCGAKIFRANESNRALFIEPFATGWVFDVEILARLICARRAQGHDDAEMRIYELPLRQWHDVAGSKVKGGDFLAALIELMKIHFRYMRGTGQGGS